MIVLLSPAKTLDFESPLPPGLPPTDPQFLDDAAVVAKKIRGLSQRRLQALLDVSSDLAALNHRRFAEWTSPQPEERSRPAALAFKGDVYLGLHAETWTKSDHLFAQEHVRILSGLYGVLRPLDRIQPYRLEMGTRISIGRKKNLPEFWREKVTACLRRDLEKRESPLVVNLASQEYFSAVDARRLDARIVTPVFKDEKNGKYKVLSFFAKRARGTMASFIVRSRLRSADELKTFDADGYRFSPESSTETEFVFMRPERAQNSTSADT